MNVIQPGLLAGGAQDHLVRQLDQHLVGEGGVGGGGGGGGDGPIELEDMIGVATVLENCQYYQDRIYHASKALD